MVVECIEREKMFRPFRIVIESEGEWERFSAMLAFCTNATCEDLRIYTNKLKGLIRDTVIEAKGTGWVRSHEMGE